MSAVGLTLDRSRELPPTAANLIAVLRTAMVDLVVFHTDRRQRLGRSREPDGRPLPLLAEKGVTAVRESPRTYEVAA